MFRIGIDLGGTKIEGVLIDPDRKIVVRKRKPTLPEKGFAAIMDRIAGLVEELESFASELPTVGICTPGSISPLTGMIRNSNTICLNGQPLAEELEKRINRKVKIENDANCFAMAEASLGIGVGYRMVFGVILGTGVGGGIVIDGALHRGAMGIAGEWGHHTLYPDGKPCYCGRRGCVETYLSGPSLVDRWRRLSGDSRSLEEICALIDTPEKEEWKHGFLEDFGLALANVVNILDPDIIVLGGGVSNIPFLYNIGKDALIRNLFSDHPDIPLLKNSLGDSAGVLGAALLWPNSI